MLRIPNLSISLSLNLGVLSYIINYFPVLLELKIIESHIDTFLILFIGIGLMYLLFRIIRNNSFHHRQIFDANLGALLYCAKKLSSWALMLKPDIEIIILHESGEKRVTIFRMIGWIAEMEKIIYSQMLSGNILIINII